MPRILPWLRDKPATKSKSKPLSKSQTTLRFASSPPQTPSTKKRRLTPSSESIPDNDGDSDPEDSSQSSPPTSKNKNASKRPNRSPFTSPPPLPTSETPMRTGWAHDDIYRMVEDEFDSVARAFTKHLHHAEYSRLKRQAAARSASGCITRPVLPGAELSVEAKRRKARQEHEQKTGKAVNRATRNHGKDGDRHEGSETDEAEKEGLKLVAAAQNRDTDQWRGTQLAKLMRSEVDKHKGVSLLGPGTQEMVKSTTRAAAGLGPGAQVTSQYTVQTMAPAKRKAAMKVQEDDDSDDLDKALSQRKSRSQALPDCKPQSTFQLQSRMPPPAALSTSRSTNTNPKVSASTSKPPPETVTQARPRKSRRGQAVSQLSTIFSSFDEPLLSAEQGPQPASRTKIERISSPPRLQSPKISSGKLDERDGSSGRETAKDRGSRKKESPRKRDAKSEVRIKLEEIPLFIA